MKQNPWIWPGMALLITGGWIGFQEKTAATLQAQTTALDIRAHELAQAGSNGQTPDRKTGSAISPDGRKIDWKKIASEMAANLDGTGSDYETMRKLQATLIRMSPQELCDQLDAIALLNIDDAQREMLETLLVNELAEKAPELALERYKDQMDKEKFHLASSMAQALDHWAKTDPAAATAWFDQQQAAGLFKDKALDGRNTMQILYQGKLILALLTSQPDAAFSRMAAMTPEQRSDLLRLASKEEILSSPEKAAAYANLVRASLPPEKSAGILGNSASNYGYGGNYQKVDELIIGFQATPFEKQVLVSEAIIGQGRANDGRITAEILDQARAWGQTHAPDAVDKATGEALSQSLGRDKSSFADAAALALHYQETTGNDEALSAFIRGNAASQNSIEESKALIQKIKDPATRADLLNLPRYR